MMPFCVKMQLNPKYCNLFAFRKEWYDTVLCFLLSIFLFLKKTLAFLHHSEGGKSPENCSAKSCREKNTIVNSWKPKECYYYFTNRKGRAHQKYMKYSKNSPHISSFFLFVALKKCYKLTKYIFLNAVQSPFQINGNCSFEKK